MRKFEYARAASIDEAPRLLAGADASGPRTNGHDRGQANGHAGHAALAGQDPPRYLAGGTDLLTLMKADVVAPALLVDIKRAEGLPRGVEERADGLVLGALTTLSDVERHPLVRERYPALAQAIGLAATPQLRNMATIGGNLLQRPRCWYFRGHLFRCWLKGGDGCPARDGENQHHGLFGTVSGPAADSSASPCVAVHPSDAASALVALGAEVRLRGPAGERALPVEELFAEPTVDRRSETVIRPDELLLEVRLPAPAAGARSTYLKAMDRKVWAFALAGAAVMLRLDDRRVADARVVLSGVATIPWRVPAAEQALVGKEAGPAAFERAADAAVAGARPLAHNGYKVPLVRSLVRRALEELAG